MTAADTGSLPTRARALAPDLARGGMLLLIALANVHLYTYGHPLGPRGYPSDISGVDQVVALLQLTLVDGRAYPLFAFLFGYGIVQLTSRRPEADPSAVTRLVRRRGFWMIVIGLVHGVLLWSGDVVGAYGLVAVLAAGLFVRGSDRGLLVLFWIGAVFTSLFYAGAGLTLPGDAGALLPSMTMADPLAALVTRAGEWFAISLLLQTIWVIGAVALGAWAGRRRYLDEPQRHRRLLARCAVVGITLAVLGGLPMGLLGAQLWTDPPIALALLAGALHALSGYAGGIGYAALFGLLAVSIAERGPGPLTGALQACGQRSLSCYLAQSVAFVALLPAWTLGLGDGAALWQVALVAIGTWVVVLVIAAVSARAGYRGPAEILLRRLTYGPRPAAPTLAG